MSGITPATLANMGGRNPPNKLTLNIIVIFGVLYSLILKMDVMRLSYRKNQFNTFTLNFTDGFYREL